MGYWMRKLQVPGSRDTSADLVPTDTRLLLSMAAGYLLTLLLLL
jgi:hypothetical protein